MKADAAIAAIKVDGEMMLDNVAVMKGTSQLAQRPFCAASRITRGAGISQVCQLQGSQVF